MSFGEAAFFPHFQKEKDGGRTTAEK